ncbi:MAG: hypothetical protein NVS1B4_00200 [Gemmatimonadaceae bacterium]
MFRERLAFKATALLLAVVLWAVVRTRETTEVTVPVRVVPLLDSTMSVRGSLPAVRAIVAARGADIAALYASPPVIRRVVRESAGDTVQLELTPADVDLEGVPGRVLDVRPRTVTLHIRHAPMSPSPAPSPPPTQQ